jgi:FkbM family methyltransferase
MHLRCLVCDLMRPLIRAAPLGQLSLLRALGGWDQRDRSWQHAPRRHRVFLDRQLDCRVVVDLADWSDRWHYYLGRYHDQMNPALIHAYLGPRDTFIDVGANHGVLTLCAARVVGAGGLVVAIEPHPEAFDRLRRHVQMNGLSNCRLFDLALSDASGEMELSPGSDDADHHGTWSLRARPEAPRTHTPRPHKVVVARGDDLLADVPLHGRVLVKVDVEGFEHHVLRGMPNLLRRRDVALAIEVTDAWLRETGSSAAAMFDDLAGLGFAPHLMRLRIAGLRKQLELVPLDRPPATQQDVFFARASMRRITPPDRDAASSGTTS